MPRVTACSTLTFALSSLQTALEHIAGYGFDRVEIADMLTHTKHFSTHSSRTVDPVAVRDLLERNGLTAIAANCALVTIYQDGFGFEKLAMIDFLTHKGCSINARRNPNCLLDGFRWFYVVFRWFD